MKLGGKSVEYEARDAKTGRLIARNSSRGEAKRAGRATKRKFFVLVVEKGS